MEESNQGFKTFEQICLNKLKEIGPSSAKKWSKAMGYDHATCLNKVIRRIKKNMPEKLKIYPNRTPKIFEAI